jgi:hypothetical protein
MKWRKGITIGIISLVVPIVVLDVMGGMVLSHDVSWYYRWGVGLGATASLLLYVIITERVKK